jgi:hypothetical protein
MSRSLNLQKAYFNPESLNLAFVDMRCRCGKLVEVLYRPMQL